MQHDLKRNFLRKFLIWKLIKANMKPSCHSRRILEPKNAVSAVKTFKDYAERVFLPYLFKHLNIVKRIDVVVWDSYNADSLKAHLRGCRGTGFHLHVSKRTRIPQNLRSFCVLIPTKLNYSSFLLQ